MSKILPVILVILLVGAFAFYAPLFPSLTITFRLEPNPNLGGPLIVTLLSWNYAKLSTTASASIQKGEIILIASTNATATTSMNALRISVTYGGSTLTPATEVLVGPGDYQMRVVYVPIAEQPDTPYRVSITVAAPGTQTFVGIVVSILPA